LHLISVLAKGEMSLFELCRIAEKIGFRTSNTIIGFKSLKKSTSYILQLRQKHFIVLIRINKTTVEVIDPEKSELKLKNHYIVFSPNLGELNLR